MSDFVPSGWRKIPINNFVSVNTGYVFKRSDYVSRGNPIVRVINISNSNELDLSNNVVHLSEERAGEFHKYLLRDDDYLLVMVGATVGKHARVSTKGAKLYLNQNMWCLRIKDDKHNSQKFAVLGLQKAVTDFLGSSMRGVTRAFLTQGEFRKAMIVVPPHTEQKKIVDILGSVNDVREKIKIQTGKLQDLKKATKLKLFTAGASRTKFKDNNLNSVPDSLRMMSLGDISHGGARDGLSKSSQYYGSYSDFEMVRMGEVFSSETITNGGLKKVDACAERENNFFIKTGDLLFARRSLFIKGVGKCVIVGELTEPTCFDSSSLRLRLNTKAVLAKYVYYYFSSSLGKSLIQKIIRPGAISGITGRDLCQISIPVPTLVEQKNIISILSSIDSSINEKRRKLQKTIDLRDSLMQDLLTGKVRVVGN